MKRTGTHPPSFSGGSRSKRLWMRPVGKAEMITILLFEYIPVKVINDSRRSPQIVRDCAFDISDRPNVFGFTASPYLVQ